MGFISGYAWGFDLATVIQAVLTTGPVVLGTDWHANMMLHDSKGFIHSNGDVVGGHAYLCTGVDTVKRYARLKNSWKFRNPTLAKGAYAYISFDDLEALILSDGEACLPIEVKKGGL